MGHSSTDSEGESRRNDWGVKWGEWLADAASAPVAKPHFRNPTHAEFITRQMPSRIHSAAKDGLTTVPLLYGWWATDDDFAGDDKVDTVLERLDAEGRGFRPDDFAGIALRHICEWCIAHGLEMHAVRTVFPNGQVVQAYHAQTLTSQT